MKRQSTSNWVKGCLSKKKLSFDIADKIIAKSNVPLRKYYCGICGSFHLTSKPLKPIKNEKLHKRNKTS